MISETIPGFGTLRIAHLALDGRLLPGVRPRLRALVDALDLLLEPGRLVATLRS